MREHDEGGEGKKIMMRGMISCRPERIRISYKFPTVFATHYERSRESLLSVGNGISLP